MANTALGLETKKQIKMIPGLVDTVAHHDEELKKHHKVMFGNGDGTIGWDEQIRTIQNWINLQIEKEKKRAAWWDKFQWVIIPMAVGVAGAFVWQVVYFYFTVVPKFTP